MLENIKSSLKEKIVLEIVIFQDTTPKSQFQAVLHQQDNEI